MTTLYEPAYAKVNLTLDVLDKRPDGYHDLQSVMQTISLRDDIEIDVGTGKPWGLHCTNENIPCDESNLAWKAARVYCDALKKDPGGLEIRITKRIRGERSCYSFTLCIFIQKLQIIINFFKINTTFSMPDSYRNAIIKRI